MQTSLYPSIKGEVGHIGLNGDLVGVGVHVGVGVVVGAGVAISCIRDIS